MCTYIVYIAAILVDVSSTEQDLMEYYTFHKQSSIDFQLYFMLEVLFFNQSSIFTISTKNDCLVNINLLKKMVLNKIATTSKPIIYVYL